MVENDLNLKEKDNFPSLNIFADLDRDGILEEIELNTLNNSQFCIVMPYPTISTSFSIEYEKHKTVKDVRPFETCIIKIVINGRINNSSSLVIQVDEDSLGKICIFQYYESNWKDLGSGGTWKFKNIIDEDEITLSLVANSFAQSTKKEKNKWNGRFILTGSIVTKDGEQIAKKSLNFQVAPFLLTSSLDPVAEVLVINNSRTGNFVSTLKEIVSQTGATLQVIQVEDGNESDVWIQDAVSIGTVCIPIQNNVKQFTTVLSGLRAKHKGINCIPLDNYVPEYFLQRGDIVINAAIPRSETKWIDWYGNLQVSPPVQTKNGHNFPLGRILVGVQNNLTMHPEILDFLNAQKLQVPPLFIDTSWLIIGHVDEVVNFVPAANQKGFRILIPSTTKAKTILESLALQGFGEQKIFADHSGETTVTKLLEEIAISEENKFINEIIKKTRAQLCEGLGVEDVDFIEIPTIFQEGIAIIPNCVNGLICNNHAILPDPLGPIVNGEDIFAAVIKNDLTNLGVKVHFIDNWDPYHINWGEIHCGTNAIRLIRQPQWWKFYY